MEELIRLPNIGPTLVEKLNKIGVTTVEQLQTTGSIEAVIRMGITEKSACYNLFYALEGTIRGVRWHAIPKDEREKIKAEFNRRIEILCPNRPFQSEIKLVSEVSITGLILAILPGISTHGCEPPF
jgi:DNA transformation protein